MSCTIAEFGGKDKENRKASDAVFLPLPPPLTLTNTINLSVVTCIVLKYTSAKMAASSSDVRCFICNGVSGDFTLVKGRGIKTLLEASIKRKNLSHKNYLMDLSRVNVHSACQKNYTNGKLIKACLRRADKSVPESSQTRSNVDAFAFKDHCLFCNETITAEFLEMQVKLPLYRRTVVHLVQMNTLRDSILTTAQQRGDEWGETVTKRLTTVTDLVAADAIYHSACQLDTQDAATYHIFRTYHQVQTWMGRQKYPLEWGWIRDSKGLLPIKTTRDPAPQSILTYISCQCKIGCTKACGCRKAGLKCSIICKNCHGQTCDNTADIIIDDNEEDDPTELLIEEAEVELNDYSRLNKKM